jgi:multidrug efflux pump subunit AcrA (membrane-fusion protein)
MGETVMKTGRFSLVGAALLASLVALTVARAQEERPGPSPRSSSQTWVVDLSPDSVCRVPAEEAGVLVAVNVAKGDLVKGFKKPIFRNAKQAKAEEESAAEPLVQIDVSLPRRQMDVAEREFEKARAEYENDVNKRYAAKASDVSKAAWMKAIEAVEKVPDSISKIEVMRLKLDYEASQLKIEQSEHERNLAYKTALVKREELRASRDAVERRRLDSPIDGIVTDVYFHEGEWVKPGDTVLRIINLNRLTVKGFLRRADHNPQDVAGKPVTVKASLKGGQEETFTGKITYVAQELLDGESYSVEAEVENRKAEGSEYFLLQPGMTVNLEIGG